MRYVIMAMGLLAVVGGLGAIKAKQIGAMMHFGEEARKSGPQPVTVGSAPVTQESWESTLSAVGTIMPVRGVSVSNDAAGVVTAVRFESGNHVQAGQILLELDSRVERAQLASAEARKDLAALSAGRSQALVAFEATTRSQVDSDVAALKSSKADTGTFLAQIDRKTVRAPFSGWLGIRNVNLGQYLNPGTAITTLEQIDSVFVDFTLPQEHLSDCKVGQPVRIRLAGVDGSEVEAVVRAIDPNVDAVTRTIKVRASVANKNEKLRPGMFVQVTMPIGKARPVVIAPATTVLHASYGDSVFVIEPAPEASDPAHRMARQQFVKLGATRGDFVAFVDGVKAGQELVNAGAYKLRNNTLIAIDNSIKSPASTAPVVENH